MSRVKEHKLSETIDDNLPYIHRDISWLSFNYRVLQEAKDPTVPLFERLKFLAIYSSNLDEFFRVRVANHRNLLRVGKKTKRKLDFNPKQLIKKILDIVNKQQLEFSRIFEKEIIPELKQYKIHLRRRLDLNKEQRTFLDCYFNDHMLPYVQPVLLKGKKVKPFLNNAALYLAVQMYDKDDVRGVKDYYGLIKIPSDHLPRFIELPPQKNGHHDLIMLDDIVRYSIGIMFPGFEIKDSYSIKLTRDAELYIDDEYSGNLIQKIKNSLTKRFVGPPARFVYDREMPDSLLKSISNMFDIDKNGMLREGRYHNNFDFFTFPDFGLVHLLNQPMPPIPFSVLEKSRDFFGEIRKKEKLINIPFHSYESVVRFFEEASTDPYVTHIKIAQYRVAKKSRIMAAIINAVKAGKQVSCFVEVKARFDEEANLYWGEVLEKAGVQVHYSWPGIKVHAKIALVRRVENKTARLYAYMSSGNFHEKTAKIYGDFGLFTARRGLTLEVARLFSYLETKKKPRTPFKHMLVGQFNLRPALIKYIDNEITNAKAGKPSRIFIKVNSLQDREMIAKLYEASQAGVKVRIIARGICCLIPGIKGKSENIKVISIVDRFLEHARVFVFHNGGEDNLYLSSADWMTRNLSYRIETVFPIYDKSIKNEILHLMEIQWNDNVKSRIIDAKQRNGYHKKGADMPVRSQLETYFYFKRKEQKGT